MVVRNRALLEQAAAVRAWTHEAVKRAEDVVQSMRKVRLAWVQARQQRDNPPKRRDLP
jgi:hypothetical protein